MTANKDSSRRPTSPHIQIYEWNVFSFSSILHRATGIVIYFSIVAIAWYIAYYTYQTNIGAPSESCDCLTKKILNVIFILAIIGLTFSLYYHFCNGIRHLFWDIGKGFSKEVARTNGYLVIALAVIFTALTIGAAIYLKFF